MDKIIARKREQQELEKLYYDGRPEFVVVYGRRRVGKTFLIREYFRDRLSFYHTALSPYDDIEAESALERQLFNFHSSLLKYGGEDFIPPVNWMEAFERLEALLEKNRTGRRMVVFIDELPWLDTQKSGFLPAFEHFWNGWGAGQDDLMLIVCGSATSWIEDKLLNNVGGLYGRMTYQMKLSPMTLSECVEFYADRGLELSLYDQLQYYMIMGGIPYYMSMLSPGKSLAANVDLLFFNKKGRLRDEFDRLFNSLFRNPDHYKSVIRLLGRKRIGYTRKEIAESTGIPYGGGLTKIMKSLEANDFVMLYKPFGGSRDDVRYKLTDPFLMFYLNFVDGAKVTSDGYWSQFENTPKLYAWRGFAFENLCFCHLSEIKRALGISGVYSESSVWIQRGEDGRRGTQVDMLIDRADRVIDLCEMKFTEGEYSVDKDEDLALRNRRQVFMGETRTRKAVHLVLITTYGLVRNRWSSVYQNVITAEDLIGK